MAARSVVFDIIGNATSFERAVTSAAGAADVAATRTERALSRVTKAGDMMVAAGRRATHAITLPVVAAAAASVKLATDFSSAMTRIQTQAGGSAKDVRSLSNQVLGLAKTTQQGPVQLANALYHLKSVGMDNVSAMKALRQASDLAAVGHANLEETTNALAGAWRTGIKGATDFHGAVQTLNAIIGAGNMSMDDLNAALGTGILPTAKTFGLTLKDVGSALAVFTDEGVPADAAATRLRMSFSLLGAPSKIASAQLKNIGLTGLKLANDMRKPNGLIVAIGDLKSHLTDPKYKLSLSQQAQLLSHAFGGGRSSSAIMSLINNFDVLKKKQDQVTKSMAKYDDAVAAQKKTPAAQFKLLESNLERTAIVMGNQFLPILIPVIRRIGDLLTSFNKLSPATKHFIAIGALVAAALGPVLSIVGRFAKLFSGISSMLMRSGRAFNSWATNAQASATRASLAADAQAVADREAAAVIAVAESEKAKAAAASATEIAASLRGTDSMLAEDARIAAVQAKEFAAAMQMRADAVVKAAATESAAFQEAALAGGRAATAIVASEGRVAASTAAAGRGAAASAARGGPVGGRAVGRGGMSMGGMVAGAGLTIAGGAVDNGKAGTTRNKIGTGLTDAGYGALLGSLAGPEGAVVGGLIGGVVGLFRSDKGDLNKGLKTIAESAKNAAAVETLWGRAIAVTGQASGVASQQIARQSAAMLGLTSKAAKAGLTQKDLTNAITGTNAQYQRTIAAWKAQGHPSAQTLKQMGDLRDEYLRAASAGRTLAQNQLDVGKTSSALNSREAALTAAVKKNGATLDQQTSFGQKNAAALRNAAVAAETHARAVYAQTGSIGKANGVLRTDVTALEATARAAGLNKSQVDAMVRSILGIPGKKSTDIKVNTDGLSRVQALATQIRDLHGKIITIETRTVTTSGRGGGAGTAQTIRTNADKGPVNTSVNAAGGRLRDGWFTVGEQGGHSNSWELGHKSGSQVDIYSNAQAKALTGWNKVPGFAAGTNHTYTVGGVKYASKLGAENAEHRLATQRAKDASALRAAAAASIKAFLSATKSAASSYGDIASAAADLRSSAKYTAAGQTKLLAYAKKRDSVAAKLGTPATAPTAYDRLATAKDTYNQNYSTYKSAAGQIDYTTLGAPTQVYSDQPTAKPTAATFIAGLKSTVATTKSFAAVLRKLVKEGMPRGIVEQLAAAGPGALDQATALSKSTPAQLASIKSLYNQQNAAAALGGKTVTDAYYLSGVRSAQGLVNGLLSQRSSLNKAIVRLADGMVNTLKKKLKIHSPSQVMQWHGAMVGEGFRLGIESKLDSIEQAGSKMAAAPRPTSNPSAAGGGTVVNNYFDIYDQGDPVAAANASARRIVNAFKG